MNTTSPVDCKSWPQLQHHAESWRDVRLKDLFENDVARSVQFTADAPGIHYDYSRQLMGAMTLRLLANLATERGLPEWRDALFSGKEINTSEKRAAWHTALRAGEHAPAEVKDTLARVRKLSDEVRDGKFQTVINLGTGGSDLGPRMVVDTLDNATCDVRFAANVDPHDLNRALRGAAPESTLIVVVSKTFTTPETMANATLAKRLGFGNFYAVTSNVEAAKSFGASEILPMWDWVGGRYSVWSAVGFAAACSIGFKRFQDFLNGASEIDQHFATAPLEKNVPVLMALAGVWNTNFLGCATHAVLPYSNALRLLPAYLQQLEMESNGKRVDRRGDTVGYATCPVVWGAEGTNSQHSFHQLLHQGTQIVPADFIVAADADRVLAANMKAQADAFAFGSDDGQYPGRRPSSTLLIEGTDARTLGRLLALYEHKVFVQGIIWNLNSFDQPGVELGKVLAKKILSGGK
jgi:glucose-6-phosphate isomerase